MADLLLILCGLISGGLIGWLLRAVSRPAADGRIERDLREQLRLRDDEMKALRAQAAAAGMAEAAAGKAEAVAGEARRAAEAALVEGRKDRDAARAESTGLRGQIEGLQRDRVGLEHRVRELDERLATEKKQIEELQERFRREFEAVSNKLLVENASRFDQRSTESLDKLLAPLKQSLTDFKQSLDSTRKETGENSVLLRDQVGRISREAANLTQALKGDVKVLGNWGEAMLDQILEKSGLQQNIHYRRQVGVKDPGGEQRFLDVVVDLPEGRTLIVDSKVSVRSYEESVGCADEAARAALLDRHVDAIRKHFRDLGRRRYPESEGVVSPDFVLMYIPVEAAYFAAIARAPGLFSEALDSQVVLITNSTLLATLRTVAHVWALAEQQKNARKIADRGVLLYEKFCGFVADLEDVQAAFDRAQKALTGAVGKLSVGPGNLVTQAEQLRKLGLKPSKSLPADWLERGGEAPERDWVRAGEDSAGENGPAPADGAASSPAARP